jgi:hypothetical protein
MGGALMGACAAAAVGSKVTPYLVVFDPTSIIPLLIIGGFTLIGGFAGALGFGHGYGGGIAQGFEPLAERRRTQ